jgi:hypothetical protein
LNDRARVFLIAFLIWIGPLASFAEINSLPLPPPPVTHRIQNVPFFPDDSEAGALASVLSFWGKPLGAQDRIAAEDLRRLKDSVPPGLDRTVRSRGLDLWLYRGSLADLRNHITMNHPVIAFLGRDPGADSAERPIVVTGYNDRDRKIIAHSPTGADRTLPYDAFVEKWADAEFLTLLILPREPSLN